MSSSSAKRRRLTIHEKLEIAEQISSGVQYATLKAKYGIGERTLTRIKSEATDVKRKVEANVINTNLKAIRVLKFPDLDAKLLEFVSLCRQVKKPVTLAALSVRALLLKNRILLSNDISDKHREDVESFQASKTWALAFTKRHALRSVSLHGEAGSVDVAKVARSIAEIRKRLEEYDIDCIFNVDETGLFYKLLPRRTYVMDVENRRSVRGTKNMGAKDRITAYVCTNADGSEKLEMAIIGKSQNPRCFRLEAPRVPYLSQKNAWSDTATFKKWFHDVFLRHVRRFTSRPVILLMDNCGPHGSDLIDARAQVTLQALPPNCTSVHQPMDQGVIAAWKAEYRLLYLKESLEDIETQEQRRQQNIGKKAGMKGMEEGYDPHMLDVTRLTAKSWNTVTQASVARCWVKAKILPAAVEADINNAWGKTGCKSTAQSAAEIVNIFSNLSIHEKNKTLDLTDMTTVPTLQEATVWLDIEGEESVQSALVEDLIADQEETAVACDANNADLQPDGDDDGPQVRPEVAIPASLPLSEMFSHLEQLAFEANVPEASVLLRRAKRILHDTRKRRSTEKPRQKLITEMFTKKM